MQADIRGIKMEYTTIKISKENHKRLDEYMNTNRLDTFDAALNSIFIELYTRGDIIHDLTSRTQKNTEERNQLIKLLDTSVHEPHEAIKSKKTTNPQCQETDEMISL